MNSIVGTPLFFHTFCFITYWFIFFPLFKKLLLLYPLLFCQPPFLCPCLFMLYAHLLCFLMNLGNLSHRSMDISFSWYVCLLGCEADSPSSECPLYPAPIAFVGREVQWIGKSFKKQNHPKTSCFLKARGVGGVKILHLFLSMLHHKNASLVAFRFSVRVMSDKQVRGHLLFFFNLSLLWLECVTWNSACLN